MEEQTITAPPVEGSPEGTGSSVADSPVQGESQAANQEQETGQPQVEGSGQQTSSEDTGRPKPSDFFHKREREKRAIYELKNHVKNLQEQIQKLGSNQHQPPVLPKADEELDYETFSKKFWDEKGSPDKFMYEYLKEMEKKLVEKYDTRFKEFKEKDLTNTISEIDRNKEIQKQQQEALEILLPKDEKNPEARLAKLDEIEKAHGLVGMFERNPKQAAILLNKLYNLEMANNKNPNAPKKSQMGSIVTGTPIGKSGGQGSMTLAEIKLEMNKLDRALDQNQNLRYDPKFKEQRSKIIELLDKREKELSGKTA